MIGKAYKPEETPFGRRIVKRTSREDGSAVIELECGHINVFTDPPYEFHQELPCSRCIDDYLKREKTHTRKKGRQSLTR